MLERIRSIRYQNLPCWYELSFQEKGPIIILRIHEDFIKEKGPIKDDAPIVNALKKEFGFKKFIGSFDGNLGFDDAFLHQGVKDNFAEFLIKVPRIKKWGGKCSHCGGSGKDTLLRGRCLRCDGKKREFSYDWKSAYAISANFTAISHYMSFFEKDTSCNKSQLLTVKTITQEDMHGGSLWGEFSGLLCRWMDSLRESDKDNIEEMVQAMQVADRKLFGSLDDFKKNYFQARVADKMGRLNVSCPGDACGLHPANFDVSDRKEYGYEFACHNVDNPFQQITLLAGLAALHDKARREIKS